MSISSMDGSAVLIFSNLTASGNTYQTGPQEFSQSVEETALAIQLERVFCAVINVKTNIFSALRVISSAVSVFPLASIVFQGNIAQRGGGVHFLSDYSTFILHPSSSVQFVNNSAILEVGAIYFHTPLSGDILRPFRFSGCLITTSLARGASNFNGTFGLFDNDIVISFQNNSAPLGGIVFGTSLETCPWAWSIPDEDGLSLYQILHRDRSATLVFDIEPVGRVHYPLTLM